ncbi:MAG TPA: DUF1064 domain-containing protein [Dissulfurispiraceae bacterium]|nr:DUF1064 domain-containing protein [Dissulfurispiraceae bacterium]
MKSKYGNKKTEIDGIKFDSKKEAAYYLKLKDDKKNNRIGKFDMQVEYELIPTIKRKGKPAVRGVKYYADFVVYNVDGSVDVIDTKGMKTPVYRLKKKMMLYFHGVDIIEK